MRAVGGNSDAARMAGINVDRVKIAVFVLAGALAAVGGLFDVFNNATANSNFGGGREFRAIICCAIGGVSMSGGSGSAYGIGLGVLLFHTLWYCLRILSVDTNLQLVLIGLILVLAVLMDIQRKRVEARKMV
jgi:ribose/xylose/arabinose/galactoside ABC-type transport system permease subunit